MVHPQKRISVKKALQGTMGRLLRIKSWLVKHKKQPYVNLDDILVDLKLTPDVLELPVPNFFIEDRKDELKQRGELMDTIAMQHSLPGPYAEEDEELELDLGPPMSIDEAIQILQRNELGRQGRQRFRVMKQMAAQEEKDRKMAESGGGQEGEDDQHHAATACQRLVRGFLARRRTRRECVTSLFCTSAPCENSPAGGAHRREEELVFLGMAAPPPCAPEDDPILRAEKTKVARKILQEKHNDGFEEAKQDVKESLYDEEGPDMREDMMDVIRQYW